MLRRKACQQREEGRPGDPGAQRGEGHLPAIIKHPEVLGAPSSITQPWRVTNCAPCRASGVINPGSFPSPGGNATMGLRQPVHGGLSNRRAVPYRSRRAAGSPLAGTPLASRASLRHEASPPPRRPQALPAARPEAPRRLPRGGRHTGLRTSAHSLEQMRDMAPTQRSAPALHGPRRPPHAPRAPDSHPAERCPRPACRFTCEGGRSRARACST